MRRTKKNAWIKEKDSKNAGNCFYEMALGGTAAEEHGKEGNFRRGQPSC